PPGEPLPPDRVLASALAVGDHGASVVDGNLATRPSAGTGGAVSREPDQWTCHPTGPDIAGELERFIAIARDVQANCGSFGRRHRASPPGWRPDPASWLGQELAPDGGDHGTGRDRCDEGGDRAERGDRVPGGARRCRPGDPLQRVGNGNSVG